MEKKRFFLAFYVGTSVLGKVTGTMDFTTNGCYLNRNKTVKTIQEDDSDSIKLSDVVLTNIIELTESDHNDWNK